MNRRGTGKKDQMGEEKKLRKERDGKEGSRKGGKDRRTECKTETMKGKERMREEAKE